MGLWSNIATAHMAAAMKAHNPEQALALLDPDLQAALTVVGPEGGSVDVMVFSNNRRSMKRGSSAGKRLTAITSPSCCAFAELTAHPTSCPSGDLLKVGSREKVIGRQGPLAVPVLSDPAGALVGGLSDSVRSCRARRST
jgi:hypothetical protein